MAHQVAHDQARTTGADLEVPLTVIALFCAAITPNVFVAGGLEWMSASVLAKYVLLPAAVIQIAILLYARGAGWLGLFIAAFISAALIRRRHPSGGLPVR